jgi:uroporphyrinogen decarboxylase
MGLRYHRKGPFFVVREPPLATARTIEEIDAYPWPSPDDSWFKTAASKAKSHYKKGFAVVADPSGPGIFELGCWLMGWARFLTTLLRRPELAAHLLDKSLELHGKFWKHFLEAVGEYTQVVLVGDDYGIDTGPFMEPEHFKRLVQPRLRRLVAEIKGAAKVAVMLHSCGAIHPLIPSLIDADVDVLSPLQPLVFEMRATQLKAKFGEDLVLHGGIDLHRPESTSLHRLQGELETLSSGGGYIFGLTSSVLDPSQLDHFKRVLTVVQQLKM